MDDGPDQGSRVISRRRLLAAGMAGTAAALAACAPGATGLPLGLSSAASSAPLTPVAADLSGTTPVVPAAPVGAIVQPALVPALPIHDRDSSMVAENARRGTRQWDTRRRQRGTRAYLAAASVGPGEPLSLRASGSGVVNVEWYRLGWYRGAGGRLLAVDHNVRLRPQPHATVDPETGLVEAHWSPVLTTAAPLGVKSGMLLAVVRSPNGESLANVPVVLRPDPTDPVRSPILFISAASTWQAYNEWGGLDFYGNLSGHTVRATRNRRAAQVSFDRPYHLDGGAGYLRRWELQFIRWMERGGHDVEYVADLDLERHPDLVNGRRMLVMAGHPEYWSRPMRTRLEAAVASGTNVLFLTANEVYWQTRLEDGPAGPATRITCYKSAAADPVAAVSPELATTKWREAPVNDPEAPLVGQMYGAVVRRVADWVVTGSRHWLYEGTRLRDGDRLRNLVGQEFDTYFPELGQPGTVILAHGHVDANGRPQLHAGERPREPIHNATMYTAQSGATVFAAGTFQWPWALDSYGQRAYRGVKTPVDERVSRMASNLFDRLGDGRLTP